MRLHWIQHVAFEGLGHIETWARKKGFLITVTKMHEGQALPDINGIDVLVIMGGPMGVYDIDIFPWLEPEKEFIAKAIKQGLKIVGICLGAQLLAEVMGARVTKNPEKEIGWFRINPSKEYNGVLKGVFDESPEVFHWHGDTFALPEGSRLICSSEACLNQGFDFEGRVIGLQFHLESTLDTATELASNCMDEIIAGGKYVQSESAIMVDTSRFDKINIILEDVFDRLIS